MKAISNKKSSSADITSLQQRYIWRDEQLTEADSVFDAWTSGNLKAMLAQLKKNTNMIDRHFLLMNIVGQADKNRGDKQMRTICHQVAQMHIKEFQDIKPALEKDLGTLPGVPTFQSRLRRNLANRSLLR